MATNGTDVRTIARVAKLFELELELETDAMSLAQLRVLAFLSDGEWAASALADWLSVSRPSVTGIVDALVEKGWVTREHCPEDRRRVLHHLTEAGRSQLDASSGVLAGVLDTVLDHLGEDERVQAERGLALLGDALARQRAAVTA